MSLREDTFVANAEELVHANEHRRALMAEGRADSHPAREVYEQLLEDYPARALDWVLAGHWRGPVEVDLAQIDFSTRASWTASHDGRIAQYAKRIGKGRIKPVVLVQRPGNPKLEIVDGHHRTLACEELGRPVLAFICKVHVDHGPWTELHGMQKKGSSKSGEASWLRTSRPFAAGGLPTDERPTNAATRGFDERPATQAAALAIVINVAGAILTVSRPEPPCEMAIPGGLVDPGETPALAASRELMEECGVTAEGLMFLCDIASPTDGRKVSVFRVTGWSGDAQAREPNTRIAWMTPAELLGQATLYHATVRELLNRGAFDVAAPFADLSPGDVHATSGQARYRRGPATEPKQMATTNAKTRKAKRDALRARKAAAKPKTKPTSGARVRIRGEIGKGGYLNVRHLMSQHGPRAVGEIVSLSAETIEAAKLSDAGDRKVWIELGAPGHYKGHPAGDINLTPGVFAEMVRNFYADKARNPNRNIPIDFNHCSEQDPTSGSIPENGTPAQGWIHDLKLDDRGHLWGLIAWGEKARGYIKSGEYQGISPAIRFGSKDKVTGEPIGARLSSAGLTNQPFLDLARLVASENQKEAETPVQPTRLSLMSSFAHGPHEYMPKIKQVFGLHESASAADCSDVLGNIRDKFAACGGNPNATHPDGMNLAKYCFGLRDLVGAAPGAEWDEDVFDVVQDLIDAAIAAHEATYHAGGTPDGGAPTTATNDEGLEPDGDMSMAEENKVATLLSETQTKLVKTSTDLSEVTQKLTLSEQALSTEKTARVAAETLVAEFSAKFSLQDAELKALTKKLGDQQLLLDAREARDVETDVLEAIATYADTKGLTADSKPDLIVIRKASATAFSNMYPKVDKEKQHLLSNHVAGGNRREPTVARIGDPIKVVVDKPALAHAMARMGHAATLSDAQARVLCMSDKDLAAAAKTYLGVDVDAA